MLSIQSTIQSQASTGSGYDVTFKVVFSETKSNAPTANTLSEVNVQFYIIVNNPCVTATVDAFTPALTTISVNQGATVTQDFNDVTDSVGNQYSNKYICGPRTYVMYDNAKSATIAWVSIQKKAGTVGTFTISAFPNDVTYSTTV